ncbi:MAG: hypothetical protein IPG57_22875 [Burkholderiales bacterium]|jgi:hypothetical protein|nr:hypothetical protein [Burkholderiales bacterium]MBP7521439.1 hypothetical protein [Leptothrix sp. (in: b-proteobacteria)]HQY07975.1 hypothetical protein [Burkholderiaceae bacterium]
MSVPYKDLLSFGSMTLLVGALGLALLLLWGWQSGQELPLWPALLVAGVNVFGALRLLQETRARQTAVREQAAASAAAAQAHSTAAAPRNRRKAK